MRSATKFALLTTLLGASLVATPAARGHAATPPSVTVSPHARLVDGQTVHITGTGITPKATVAVNQCEDHFGNNEADCNDAATATASAAGKVSLSLPVAALVYRNIEFGDPIPEYCRADDCHVFLSWTDEDGVTQTASSIALKFQGAPAHIHVHPSTDLRGTQRVLVNGSAHGAAGHKVQILEEACFQMVQGSGCYDPKKAVTTKVAADGTWSVHYQVHRHLSDGNAGDPETDCAETYDLLGQCELTVVVLGKDGQPDASFGDPRLGDPAVVLSWHAHPPRQTQ